ncbi:ABC transporter permease [Paenibacillus methanolicus]|uniref:ABC-2 type transport system permease protein n=1 Tax=Paenibacillus methanolicus TaxID=582686 RepID=A0A5S5BQL2_9BACL|nr:ABC transporter permease subunit [Paenibacillus methanolicus]TYP68618.1 ABC-2 type transport system permease protein [Paenibacillus methanolicus]
MTVWWVLVRKEWRELLRSYKLLWVPAVFLLLGGSQPVAMYFMPEIIARSGGMPAGALIEIPTPQAFEVLAQTLQQFGLLGLLVLALAGMGAVSGERIAGTAIMTLVKPVSPTAYVTSKWAALLSLTSIAVAAGYGAALYYTSALFGSVSWKDALLALIIFMIWTCVLITMTLALSAFLGSGAAAAFVSLAAAVVVVLLTGAFPDELHWSPGALPGLASRVLAGEGWPAYGWAPLIAAISLLFVSLAAAVKFGRFT